jgi:hypothetical protein
MNPINHRLGRKNYTAKAQRKKVLETCERIKRECPPDDWKQKLADSVRDVIDIDDCTEVYK